MGRRNQGVNACALKNHKIHGHIDEFVACRKGESKPSLPRDFSFLKVWSEKTWRNGKCTKDGARFQEWKLITGRAASGSSHRGAGTSCLKYQDVCQGTPG